MKLLLFLLSFLIAYTHGQYTYDCRRQQDCANGATCLSDGQCACANGFNGHRCDVVAGSTSCSLQQCENEGTCYVQNNTEKCSCATGYLGEDCNIPRVNITCGGSAINYQIFFPESFDGLVELSENAAIPGACAFTTTLNSGIEEYSLEISLTDATDANICGKDMVTVIESASDTRLNRLIKVQYMKTLVTAVDELVNVTCVQQHGNITLYPDITSVALDGVGNLTVIDEDDTYSPVGFALLDSNKAALAPDSQLYVGEVFFLHVFVTDTTVFKSVKIEQCVANDTMEVDPKLFAMFNQSCPTRSGMRTSAGQVALNRTQGAARLPGKALQIQAFKFLRSDKIGLSCSLKLCKEGDTSCDAPSASYCDQVRAASAATGGGAPATDGGTNEGTATGPNGGAERENATDTGTSTGTDGGGTPTGTETGGNTTGTGNATGGETPTESDGAPDGDTGGVSANGTGDTAGTEGAAGGETGSAGETTGNEGGAGPDTSGRKRRAADDDEKRTVSTVLTVKGSRAYTNEASTGQPLPSGVESCLARTEILAVLIVLAILACVLFIACFVLAFCLVRRKQKSDSTTQYHGNDRFQIPRAHVNEAYREL